jgi:hypothetical protein
VQKKKKNYCTPTLVVVITKRDPHMIILILAKLYGIILEKHIILSLEIHGKIAKGQVRFKRYHSTVDHIVTFRIIERISAILKPIFFIALLTLQKLLTWFLGKTFGTGWKR